MPTPAQVKAQMDALYASGKAYKASLPFDTMRGDEIRRATLALASPWASYDAFPVLDIGSGEGGIASFWPHSKIVGIEISQVAVERAQKAYPSVQYHCLPVERLHELEHPPFHLAVAQESIEHWTEVPNSLLALRKKMAPAGHLVITTPNRDSLHCRMARKFGREAPYCSTDHIHEFGYQELIETVEAAGFVQQASLGACLTPYWAISELGPGIRSLTDKDAEVNEWLNDIARHAPAEYAFIQCHRFEAV